MYQSALHLHHAAETVPKMNPEKPPDIQILVIKLVHLLMMFAPYWVVLWHLNLVFSGKGLDCPAAGALEDDTPCIDKYVVFILWWLSNACDKLIQ